MEEMFPRKLPPVYKRNEKDCYLDPIRKKLIYITPEETIRQRVLSYLTDTLHVPIQEIILEQHLSHYGIKSKKRADIIIHGRDAEGISVPIAVVECKAPNVYLDMNAQEQMFEYCELTGADYAMLTNGVDRYCFRYDSEKDEYVSITSLPDYKDMLSDKYEKSDIGELPARILFNQLESYLKKDFSQREEDDYGNGVSKLTPISQEVPIFNLWEGLLDIRVKIPTGKYKLFELIEDYGIRMLSYGNASGGRFYGPYRSFLVKVNENTEFFSIGVTTYCTSASSDKVKTYIVVAHDDEKEAHHALQLAVEDNVTDLGNKVNFYHHGRITVGRKGSRKVDELRRFVEERYPKIISGNHFFLGSLVNDRLWRLDDPDVIEIIENLISYSIFRDEYREYVKNH